MPDPRLDGRPALDVLPQRLGHASPLSRHEDFGALHAMIAVASVDEGELGQNAGQFLHLLERFGKRVAVIGGSRQGQHADGEAFPVRDGQRNLASELVGRVRLSLGDAVDVRLVNGVDLVAVPAPLLQEPFGHGEFRLDPFADAGAGDKDELSADVRRDLSREAAQLLQDFFHQIVPAAAAQPERLAEKFPGEPRVCPPRPDAALAGEFQQALAGLVVKLSVQWKGDVLVHHRRVDGHLLEAASVH